MKFRIKVFYNSWLAKRLLFPGYHTIMLFGAVFTQKREHEFSKVTENHESIHVAQFLDILLLSLVILTCLALISGLWWLILISPLVYYLWYVMEYAIRRLKSFGRDAYRSISFEQEAYGNQHITGYNKTRSFMSFLKYL